MFATKTRLVEVKANFYSPLWIGSSKYSKNISLSLFLSVSILQILKSVFRVPQIQCFSCFEGHKKTERTFLYIVVRFIFSHLLRFFTTTTILENILFLCDDDRKSLFAFYASSTRPRKCCEFFVRLSSEIQ